MNQPTKSFLKHDEEEKEKTFFGWTLKIIEQSDIYVFSDKNWHKIGDVFF